MLCSALRAVDQEHDADQAHSERMENRGFGTLLRDNRLAAGLTQDALADRASLSVRGIADLGHVASAARGAATSE